MLLVSHALFPVSREGLQGFATGTYLLGLLEFRAVLFVLIYDAIDRNFYP